MPAHCGPLLGFPVLFVIKHLSLSIAPSISSVFVALWAGLDEDDGGVWLCGLRNGSGRGERGVWALNGKAMRLYCSERRGGRPRLKAVSVRLSPSSRGFSIKRGIFGERRVSLFDGGRDMASGQGKDVAFLFADEELSGMTGLKRGADFVEVMCGCTSHRYGDAVGRLRVFASGDLEINCECTPGCEEGELDHLMPRVLMLRKCCLED
ncbi:hypothetical protein BHE74_00047902 [Ensete ventricosum]|nr:hypothetical protein BHE74_00047902 [Ensete ventricosum]